MSSFKRKTDLARSFPTLPSTSTETEQKRAFWDEDGTAFIDNATEYAEVGKFQIYLLVVCLIAYSSTSIIPNVLRKFTFAVQCDLQLLLEDEKVLLPFSYYYTLPKILLSMLVGGVAWSLLGDTLSRKWTLVMALLALGVSICGIAFSSSFLTFGLFRGLGALSVSGVRCLIITFLSEFQIRYYRGSMICCLQLGWVIGMVAISLSSFSWRNLILAGTIPVILAIIGLSFFPDSPRFLLSRGRDKAALRSLQMIHAINTGTKRHHFPIQRVIDNQTVAEIKRSSIVKIFIPSYMRPKFICIPIVMLTQLAIMFSYYTLAEWFPYMVAREESFFPTVIHIPQDCKATFIRNHSTFKDEYISETGFFGTKYIYNNTMILNARKRRLPNENNYALRNKLSSNSSITMIAVCCMPPLIWIVLKVDTLGRKFFLTFSHIVAGFLAFVSYFMHNVETELLFACLFDSVTLMSLCMSHCLAVELFPTRVRILGVALVAGSSQLGAILADIGGAANLGFSCIAIVALISSILAFSGLLTLTLSDTTGISLR